MRYQIKEAFDKFLDVTNAEASKVSIISACPNDIRLSYTDHDHKTHEFKYTNGKLYLRDEVDKTWFALDEFNCTCQGLHFLNS